MSKFLGSKPSVRQITGVQLAIVVAWIVYVALGMLAPVQRTYHLVVFQLDLLRATVVVPILIIWLVAAYGAAAFRHYGMLLGDSLEGKAIRRIALAVYWTLGYFVVNTIFTTLLPFYRHSAGYPGLVVLRDELTAVLTLVTFIMFYQGANMLRSVVSFVTWTRSTAWAMAAYGVFAFVFVYRYATSTPYVAAHQAPSALQYVSPTILLYTLVLPYLVAWFLGVLAAINIAKYSSAVQGILYRRALKDLVRGVWAVIVFSAILQLLTLVLRSVDGLPLGPILMLVYALIILYGISYAAIARGAIRLARIEVAE